MCKKNKWNNPGNLFHAYAVQLLTDIHFHFNPLSESTTQNVQLHEKHIHAKYEVAFFNIAKVIAKC